MKPVRFAPESVAELGEAAAWYACQVRGLEERFLEEVEQTLISIRTRPLSFPRLSGLAADLQVRRALLPRFPYAVLFLDLDHEIRIVTVAHLKREPAYWLNRLEP